jgi:hypothetical protein
MKIIISESKFSSLVKKLVKPKFHNFTKLDPENPLKYELYRNYGNKDNIIGIVTSQDGELVGYLMENEPSSSDSYNYFYLLILERHWDTVGAMFDLPRFQIQDIFTELGKELTNVKNIRFSTIL